MKKRLTFGLLGVLVVAAWGGERLVRPDDLRPLLQQRLHLQMRSQADPLTWYTAEKNQGGCTAVGRPKICRNSEGPGVVCID